MSYMKLRLSVRIEAGRLEKLRRIAKQKRKTMTQLIEDWIDRIKEADGAVDAARVAFPPRAKAAGRSSSRPIHVLDNRGILTPSTASRKASTLGLKSIGNTATTFS